MVICKALSLYEMMCSSLCNVEIDWPYPFVRESYNEDDIGLRFYVRVRLDAEHCITMTFCPGHLGHETTYEYMRVYATLNRYTSREMLGSFIASAHFVPGPCMFEDGYADCEIDLSPGCRHAYRDTDCVATLASLPCEFGREPVMADPVNWTLVLNRIEAVARECEDMYRNHDTLASAASQYCSIVLEFVRALENVAPAQ